MPNCSECGKSHRQLGIRANEIKSCGCGNPHSYCPTHAKKCLQCAGRSATHANRVFGSQCRGSQALNSICPCTKDHCFCQTCVNAKQAGIFECSICGKAY